jgi:hypothetical protein
MVALSKVAVKVFGPYSPKEFSDLTTLNTTISTAVQAIADASANNSVIDTEVFSVLGNMFVMVTYQIA